jgi:hypothetical protein
VGAAASQAQEIRNVVMDVTRRRSTPVGRAITQWLKAEGKTLKANKCGDGRTMDFVLRYRGPLSSTGSPQDKHRIRCALHPQLDVLCRQEPLLEQACSDQVHEGVLKGRQVEVPKPLGEICSSRCLSGVIGLSLWSTDPISSRALLI